MDERRSFGVELHSIMQIARRKMHETMDNARPDQATMMHVWVVSYLYQHQNQDIFQRDFEKQFSIRRSTATKMLQLMEKNGLISRESVPYDARLKKLMLTDKALQLHKTMIARMQAMDEKMLAGLTEAEQDTLFTLLDKIKRNID